MYTITQLIDFGNYLLSTNRNAITSQKDVVSDADLANFFLLHNIEYSPDANQSQD